MGLSMTLIIPFDMKKLRVKRLEVTCLGHPASSWKS